jgi:hypothetical protein
MMQLQDGPRPELKRALRVFHMAADHLQRERELPQAILCLALSNFFLAGE